MDIIRHSKGCLVL